MTHFAALVLAAGAGRRFGGAKLTSAYDGGRLIDGALQAAFASPSEIVIVVVGSDPAVAPAALALADRLGQSRRLRIVAAADHAQGLSASLKAGLAAIPEEADGVFLFLGDMPHVPHALAAELARSLGQGLAAAPMHAGRRGHPVLFARALFPRLAELDGDKGAGAILGGLGPELILLNTDDPGVLFDVDLREDACRGAIGASD